MGTGSMGGGSGSFGGGGSGGRGGSGSGGNGGDGGGGKGGGSGGTDKGRKGTDSTHDRIRALTLLTANVNKNPEIAKVRALIYQLLQDRTRAAFLKVTFADPLVLAAYRSLLSLEASLRGGTALAEAASRLGAPAGGTLSDVADAIKERGQSPDTDERIDDITRRAISDVLLRTVGNQQDLYYETPLEAIGAKFDATPLATTADFFLAMVMREAVRRDLLELSAEGRAAITDASREIAVSWIDKFKSDYRDERNVPFRDLLSVIASDYSRFSGGENE